MSPELSYEQTIDEYISDKIATGQFKSPEEFARHAISAYRDREYLQALGDELKKRVAAADRGELVQVTAEDLKRRLRETIAARTNT